MTRSGSIRYLTLLSAILGFCLFPRIAIAEENPTVGTAKANSQAKLLSTKRIWSAGVHNAFPDLEFFQGKWYAGLREGTAHGISGYGRLRIISSADGEDWESVALFEDFGDYRRAELSITPENKLMVAVKFNFYVKDVAATDKPFKVVDHQGGEHQVVSIASENRVAFSEDGNKWTNIQAVKGAAPTAWFYSGVQWHKGMGYAIDRMGPTLYRTRDGVKFEPVSQVPVSNESRISFLPDSTMIVFFRDGSLASSAPPYKTWKLNEKNKKGPHSFGGPGIIALPDGSVWTASRHRGVDTELFHFPAKGEVIDSGTLLCHLQGEKLVPQLLICGTYDAGYNGMVWRDGFLWMVYNSPVKEGGQSWVWLAKIQL